MTFTKHQLSQSRFSLIIFIMLLLSGCTIQLIASYDKATDEAVTALHRKVTTFLIDVESKLGTSEADYDNFPQFYRDLRTDLSALELRVSALPKNRITQTQIATLKQSISNLEDLHRIGFGNDLSGQKAALSLVQDDFNRSLAAILKLELAKRRGEEPEE